MDKSRSISLIDGGWLEKARRGIVSDAKWDLQSFANRLVPRYHWRFRTYYFDALPFKDRNSPSNSQQEKYRKKEEELRAIDRLERFTVRKGTARRQQCLAISRAGDSSPP